MKQKRKKLLSFLLALAMVVGLMPGMSLTAYAAEELKAITMDGNTLKIDSAEWNTEYDGYDRYYLPSGNYKLGSNIETNFRIAVRQGETVTLDIGEYNITRKKDEGDAIEVSGNLTINGTTGSIINNNFGSCILVGETGALTLNDGTITNNGGDDKSRCEGVNVCGKFTMNGGSLANNTKAVRLDDGAGTFIMNGGSITRNTYGIVLQNANASVTLSDKAVITGNTESNVYICTSATNTLRIDNSHLGSDSSIGVTTQTQPSADTDVKVATGAIKDDIPHIHSDMPGNAGTIFCDGTNDWVYYNGVAQLKSGVVHHTHEKNTVWLSVAANTSVIEENVSTCSVTFNSNGHGTSTPANQMVEKGQKVTKPTDPTENGFDFGGWYKEAVCTNAWNFDSDTINGTTVLYAKWTLNSACKPTANELTYNGEAQALVTAPTSVPDGYTVQYSLDGENWSTDIPKGTNAGDYTVKVKYVGDANHSDFNGTDISVTIGKAAAPTLTDNQKPTAKTGLTYTGSDQTLVTAPIEIPVGYTGIQYALGTATEVTASFTATIPTATNAGTYYVWYKVVGDENHKNSEAGYIPVEIAKASITITPDDKTSQYKKELQKLTWKVSGAYVDGDDLGISASTTATDTAEVGEYPITVTWNNNPNYDATLKDGKYTVTKTDLTVTATGYTGKYDGKAHSITVDVGDSGAAVYYSTEKKLTAENYKTAGSTTAPTRIDAGKTTVYYYVESTNYEPKPVNGRKEIEITKADALTDADLKDGERAKANPLTYNGEAQELVIAPKSLPTGYAKVQYQYSEDGGVTWSEYSDSVPTGINAGSYVVKVKYVADGNHTDFEGTPVNVTIQKAAVENKTVAETIEVSSAGAKDKTIDLKDYLVAGAALAQKEAADGTTAGAKVETTGALASLITPGTLKSGVFTYSVAENDGGLTGQMILTISSTNYADYTITINLASAKKVTEIVVESEGVTETAVETVEVPALEDFTEAQPEATVEVKMEVKLESEAKVEEKIGTATLNKIEEAVNKAFGGVNSSELQKEYLDVTVTKSVNGGAAQEVADVNRVLEIAVGYDLTGKYNLVVVREHGGSVNQFTKLNSRPAAGSYKDGTFYVEGSGTTGKIYIYARYFSTYTVAYTTTASYQVTFDDALGHTEQVVVATGNKVTKPTNPKRGGYDFAGWYVDGTNTKWNFDTAVTGDLVLKAKWSEQDDDDDDEKDGGVVVTPVSTPAQPRSPKTGDVLPGYGFWLILMAAGIAVSAGAGFGRKKED